MAFSERKSSPHLTCGIVMGLRILVKANPTADQFDMGNNEYLEAVSQRETFLG